VNSEYSHPDMLVSTAWIAEHANDPDVNRTLKSQPDLKKLYSDAGVDFSKPTIAYSRISDRSIHTCFVAKCLLGVDNVKNYDGSWIEWGNSVRAPIETGEAAPALPKV
jgi:thiosulfate/3-mercaptopyruvate sulfurtransferase